MKFLKFLGLVMAVLVGLVLLWSLGSAFFAQFIQGGVMFRASPFQLLLGVFPYLLGMAVIFGAVYWIYLLSFPSKTK